MYVINRLRGPGMPGRHRGQEGAGGRRSLSMQQNSRRNQSHGGESDQGLGGEGHSTAQPSGALVGKPANGDSACRDRSSELVRGVAILRENFRG